MDERARRRDGGEGPNPEPLSDYIKAYIDQQVQTAIKEQEEMLTRKKKWRNSWRSASPITKVSLLVSFAALASTIAYTIAAWRTLVVMRQISSDSSQQTNQLIDAATQMKTAAWQFKGSAEGIDGNLGDAVDKLNIQATHLANNVTQTGRLATAAEKSNANVIAADRPWIGLESPILMSAVSGQPPEKVEFKTTIKNFGHSPAFNVIPEVDLVVGARGTDIRPEIDRVCQRLEKDILPLPLGVGEVLFPSDVHSFPTEAYPQKGRRIDQGIMRPDDPVYFFPGCII